MTLLKEERYNHDITMDWDTVLLLIVISCGILLCLILIASLIYSNCKRDHNTRIKSVVLYTTYSSIFLFAVCLGANLTNFELLNVAEMHEAVIGNTVSMLSWNFAQILVFILYMLRLHLTFSETVYKVSRGVYIFCGLLIIAYLLCSAIWVVHSILILRIHFHDEQNLKPIFNTLSTSYFIGIEVINLSMSMVLISLFVGKMVRVAVALRDDPLHQSPSMLTLTGSSRVLSVQQKASLHINDQQMEMLNAVTKYSVLSVVATIMTAVSTLVFCGCLLSGKIVWGSSMAGLFLSVDCIVNPVCLFLLFAINKRIYRMLCSRCHICCGWCLRKITQSRAQKKYYKALQEKMLSSPRWSSSRSKGEIAI